MSSHKKKKFRRDYEQSMRVHGTYPPPRQRELIMAFYEPCIVNREVPVKEDEKPAEAS